MAQNGVTPKWLSFSFPEASCPLIPEIRAQARSRCALWWCIPKVATPGPEPADGEDAWGVLLGLQTHPPERVSPNTRTHTHKHKHAKHKHKEKQTETSTLTQAQVKSWTFATQVAPGEIDLREK